jgi:hypothetical protein
VTLSASSIQTVTVNAAATVNSSAGSGMCNDTYTA